MRFVFYLPNGYYDNLRLQNQKTNSTLNPHGSHILIYPSKAVNFSETFTSLNYNFHNFHHEVGGNALTVCMLLGLRASSILVKGSANSLLSYNTTQFFNGISYCNSTFKVNDVKLLTDLSHFHFESERKEHQNL